MRGWPHTSSISLPLRLELTHRLCREASPWSRRRRDKVAPCLRWSLHLVAHAEALRLPPLRVNLSCHRARLKFLCRGLVLEVGPLRKTGSQYLRVKGRCARRAQALEICGRCDHGQRPPSILAPNKARRAVVPRDPLAVLVVPGGESLSLWGKSLRSGLIILPWISTLILM